MKRWFRAALRRVLCSILSTAGLALALMPVESARASCGSAACSVNTDWATLGAFTEPGARVDVRAEYIPQDQPRHGAKAVSVGEIPAHHDEVHTWNRNLVATADYTFSSHWGAAVSLPYVDRDHKHIHNHHGEKVVEKWHITGVGDAKALGRYQVAPEGVGTVGVMAGVKLPTGATRVKNSEGEEAERPLQPGTGTTDSILGAYLQRPLGGLGWFVQAQRQSALAAHDDFRPGDRTTLDTGVRYDATHKLALLLQVNALWKERDEGLQAEPEDSGGRFYFVSPGMAWAFTHDVQMYGFYQHAVYQYVNGVQLTADGAAVVGGSVRF